MSYLIWGFEGNSGMPYVSHKSMFLNIYLHYSISAPGVACDLIYVICWNFRNETINFSENKQNKGEISSYRSMAEYKRKKYLVLV